MENWGFHEVLIGIFFLLLLFSGLRLKVISPIRLEEESENRESRVSLGGLI